MRILAFRRDPIGFLGRLARDYGDIAAFRLGPQQRYLLSHPDHVQDVLVTQAPKFFKGRGLERAKTLLGEGLLTSEGEFHLRQRRLAQPAFHRQRVAAYGAEMAARAVALARRWTDSAVLDVHAEMMRLTLSIAGKTLFDTEVESEASEIGRALDDAMQLFHLVVVPYRSSSPLPFTRRFRRARARLDATIYRIIRERRASGEDRGDLLSMLLAAQDVEERETPPGGNSRSPDEPKAHRSNHGMTDEQLRDECMTLFLAGHETTANALTWSWHLLAKHPVIESRVHAEVDHALGSRIPGADDLPKLHYTEMVFAEAMLLYPPAWAIGRRVIAPCNIAGYDLPVGSIVVMSQYLMHRDPRFFANPEHFDPERWTPEARAARPRFCYFPFGAGPRQCIGEAFAWMEGILVLATIAQRWRLTEPGNVRVRPLITLRPGGSVRMRARSRAGNQVRTVNSAETTTIETSAPR